jgi:hypothetical protein
MLFKGTTEECFAHFATQYPGRENQKVVAEFIEAQPLATYRWYTKRFTAVGETLVRVRCMFELLDYYVTDYMIIPEPIRQLTRLMAYGCTTFGEIVPVFEFEGDNRHSAMGGLTGKRGVSNARIAKIEEFANQYVELIAKSGESRREVLVKKLQPAAPRQLPVLKPVASVLASRAERSSAAAVASISQTAREAIIESAARQVLALLPLAELLFTDEFTAAERGRFRDLTGNKGVFNLSNCLNGLCGERMRERQIAQQQATSIRGRK